MDVSILAGEWKGPLSQSDPANGYYRRFPSVSLYAIDETECRL